MSLRSIRRRRRTGVGTLAALLLILVPVAAATADGLQPITIGGITVGDGALTAAAGTDGNSTAAATVTVNGRPATIDASGNISADLDLSGQTALTVTVTNTATGQTSTITIPISLVGPAGVVPATALELLRQAGVTVNVPPAGLVSVGGQPVRISGSIADRSGLASLTVDGVDALSLLRPDGTFTTTVPGTDKQVVVGATDRQGVTESQSYQITPATSPNSSRSSSSVQSVGATSASGVAIAGVRYRTKGVKTSRRINVTVTVKDKRGLLIRGAKVAIRPAFWQHNYVVGTTAAKVTNGSGQVTFTLKLRAAKFNQRRRLFTVETARTPSSQATRTTSVRLPHLGGARKR